MMVPGSNVYIMNLHLVDWLSMRSRTKKIHEKYSWGIHTIREGVRKCK